MPREEQAVEIGTTNWACKGFEVNRKLPLAKNLRAQSHSARVGLRWVGGLPGGRVLQALAAILALFEVMGAHRGEAMVEGLDKPQCSLN
jgi:hypothetical protein